MIKPTPAKSNRGKRNRIAGSIRQEIIKGHYRPGSRIPTYVEIQDRFDASSVTVERAIRRLIKDGFIYTRGRLGTFVSHRPPHLSNYVLVLPENPSHSLYYQALAQEGPKVAQRMSGRLHLVTGHAAHPSHESYQKLVDEVKSEKIAGVIFVVPPASLEHTPLLKQPGLPKVVIGGAMEKRGFTVVVPDYDSVYQRLIQQFVSQGCQRIALLEYNGFLHIHKLRELFKAQGLTINPIWSQVVSSGDLSSAYNLAQLLMSLPAALRPDALYIADDNLVESATRGLAEVGAGRDFPLSVIAHCNFPILPKAHVPVRWLGFDVSALLDASLQLIARQRQHEQVPLITNITCKYEKEVNSEELIGA